MNASSRILTTVIVLLLNGSKSNGEPLSFNRDHYVVCPEKTVLQHVTAASTCTFGFP